MLIKKLLLLASLFLLTTTKTIAQPYQPCRLGLIVATTPSSQFKDNLDGTVTDLKTKLVWKKCREGQQWSATENTCLEDNLSSNDQYNWKEALEWVQQVNVNGGFAGSNEWRVPNIKELSSIIENACYGPSINIDIFPNTISGIFWSSTPYQDSGKSAWTVRFNYGQNSMNDKYEYYFLRLVRDPS